MTVGGSRPAVAVIGGNGYLGGRIAALLEALPVDVSVAGRRSPLRVDLDDESTLGALDAFDVVIDAADLRAAAPDAEGLMLHWSTGVATTRAGLAPAPGAPGWLARLGLALTPWWLLRRRSVEAAVARVAAWFRRKVLRGRRAPVEVLARADAGGYSAYRSVWVSDGMEATAACAAAAVDLLLRRRERRPGLHLPDQLFELPELVDSARRLAGEALEIKLSRDAAPADRS